MNGPMKAFLLEYGGKLLSQGLRFVISQQTSKKSGQCEDITETKSVEIAPSVPSVVLPAAPKTALPTSDETTDELKRRLAKELYKAELDLANGMMIAGKPCDCMDHKHGLYLEAASEELVAQDPGNPGDFYDAYRYYQDIKRIDPQVEDTFSQTVKIAMKSIWERFSDFEAARVGVTFSEEVIKNDATIAS